MIDNIPFIALLAPLALMFNQVRSFLLKLLSFSWKEISIQDLELKRGLLNKLAVYPKFNFDNFAPKLYEVYSKKDNNKYIKVYKDPLYYIYLYKNCIPVVVKAGSYHSINIYYLKLSFPINKILNSLHLEKQTKDEFYIVNHRGNRAKSVSQNTGETHLNSPSYLGSYDKFYLSNSVEMVKIDREKFIDNKLCSDYNILFEVEKPYQYTDKAKMVMQDVKKWKDSEGWYAKKSIRYFRGHLLHGKPGTGKSSLVVDICRKLKIPLHIYDLSSYDNESFLKTASGTEKAVILFEDLDCTFCGRENITKTETSLGLTFDCLINKINGINDLKNKYLFITTNKIQTIDQAILRPGRCDIITELESMNNEEKIIYAQNILEKDIDTVVKDGKYDNNAEFENRVVTEALNRYWNVEI